MINDEDVHPLILLVGVLQTTISKLKAQNQMIEDKIKELEGKNDWAPKPLSDLNVLVPESATKAVS